MSTSQNYCKLYPEVNGQKSILWEQLDSIFKHDRKKVKRAYAIAMNPKFKDYLAKYPLKENEITSQGEITGEALANRMNGRDVFKFVKDNDLKNAILADKTLFSNALEQNSDGTFDDTNSGYEDSIEGYTQALNEVCRYNKSHDHRKLFKACITYKTDKNGRGKYQIELVKWSLLTRSERTQFINRQAALARKEEIKHRILRKLASNGVNIMFLQDGEESTTTGRYEDRLISATEEGYNAYWKILKNPNNSEDADQQHFLIRAGIFAVETLGYDDPLLKRSEAYLDANPEAVERFYNEVIQDDYIKKVVEQGTIDGQKIGRKKVVMAYLVGKAIENNQAFYNRWPVLRNISNVIFRIAKKVQEIFNRVFHSGEDPNIVALSSLADKIAQSFNAGEYGEDELQLHDNMSEIAITHSNKVLENGLRSYHLLQRLIPELKKRGVKTQPFEMMGESLKNFDRSQEDFARLMQGQLDNEIASSLGDCIDLLFNEKYGLLNSDILVGIESSYKYDDAMKSYGDKIKAARIITQNMLQLIKFLKLDTLDTRDEAYTAMTQVLHALSQATEIINTSAKIITTKFFSTIIGADYVAITSGKYWKWQEGKAKTKDGLEEKQEAELERLGLKGKERDTAPNVIRKGNKIIIKVEDLITESADISFGDMMFLKMGRTKDTVLQLVDVYNRQQQHDVRNNVVKTQNKIKALRDYAVKNNVNVADFFERAQDDNGYGYTYREPSGENNILTGNLIQQAHYDRYERDVNEFKRSCWKDFLALHPNIDPENNTDYSPNDKYNWETYWRQRLELWNMGMEKDQQVHGWWNKEAGVWVPCISANTNRQQGVNYKFYDNLRYGELFGNDENNRTEQQKHNWYVYNELMQIKKELDKRCLEFDSTKEYRAPQFKATFINEISTHGWGINKGDANVVIKRALRRFAADSDVPDYGDDRNHVSTERSYFDPFATDRKFKRHATEAIPKYGINKLRDPNSLSTDLFYSLMSYAYMCENYKACKNGINTLELYRDIIEGKGGNSYIACPNKSQKLQRYLHSEFYSDHQEVYKVKNGNVFDKHNKRVDALAEATDNQRMKNLRIEDYTWIAQASVKFCNKLASYLYLGGNVVGGCVNSMSGLFRLATEALHTDRFNMAELTAANVIWLVCWFENFLATRDWRLFGKQIFAEPKNKMVLWQQKFDPQNNFKEKATNMKRRTVSETISDLMMFDYEVGDNYMNSVGFIANALHTKLIDEKGNKTNYWKAMKVHDDGINPPYLAFDKDKHYFISEERRKKFLTLKPLYDIFEHIGEKNIYSVEDSEIMNYLETFYRYVSEDDLPVFSTLMHKLKQAGALELTSGTKNYPLRVVNKKKLYSAFKDYMNELQWSREDEERYAYMARDLNTCMHGIYNTTDKVAFQRTLFGALVSTMKGYAFGYIMREFAAQRVDMGSGQRMTLEEFMKKYNFEDDYKKLGRDSQLIANMYCGGEEFAGMVNSNEFGDIDMVNIFDTDNIEGSAVTCLKMMTDIQHLFPAIMTAVCRVAVGSAAIVPGVNGTEWSQKARAAIDSWDKKSGMSKSQQTNIAREIGMGLMLLLTDILRIIVGAKLPPPPESDDEYEKRLVNIVNNYATYLEKQKNGTITKEEKKWLNAMSIERLPGETDDEYGWRMVAALKNVEPQHTAKPTMAGLMYCVLARTFYENASFSIFFPGQIYREATTLFSIIPPVVSAMGTLFDIEELGRHTTFAKDLLTDVTRKLENTSLEEFEFVKKHHNPTVHEYYAAVALNQYCKDKLGEKKMTTALPDLNSDDLFKYTINGIDPAQLTKEDKDKIRRAAYNYMKEIWGKDRSTGMHALDKNDERHSILTGRQAKTKTEKHTIVSAKMAKALTGKETDEKINEVIEENTLAEEDASYIVNEFYYSKKGYGYDKYDLKIGNKVRSYVPYIRSLKPIAEPLKYMSGWQYFRVRK